MAHTVLNIERLQRSAPNISYDPSRKIGHDTLVLSLSSEQAMKACEQIKREDLRKANQDAMGAFLAYRDSLDERRYLEMERRYFPIARGIRVPVNPPLFASDAAFGKILWFSFWRARQLSPMQKAIFGTILDHTVFRHPDFLDSDLEFVDLSSPAPKEDRAVALLNRRDFPVLTDAELRAHTDKFAEAFHIVRERTERRMQEEQQPSPSKETPPLLLLLDQQN